MWSSTPYHEYQVLCSSSQYSSQAVGGEGRSQDCSEEATEKAVKDEVVSGSRWVDLARRRRLTRVSASRERASQLRHRDELFINGGCRVFR